MGRSLKVALIVFLAILVLMLMISLAVNNVDLWIVWTRLGDEELYIVLAVVLYILLPQVQQGLVLVLTVLLSGALNVTLKYMFNMPRPPNPLIEVSGPSFPSGHAQVSSSFWSALSLITMKKLIAAISTIIIVGVSLSRILLRAHYEIDVVVGALIGLMVGYASYRPFTYYLRKKSYALYYVIVGMIMVMSAYNMIYLGTEMSSLTAILGLSLAILTTLLITKIKSTKISNPSMFTRIIECMVSVVMLLSVHLLTENFDPLIRLACFYVAGLSIFTVHWYYDCLLKGVLVKQNE